MKFQAEIIKIEAKKTASLDKIFRLVIETDQNVTELQKYIAIEAVEIEVKEVK